MHWDLASECAPSSRLVEATARSTMNRLIINPCFSSKQLFAFLFRQFSVRPPTHPRVCLVGWGGVGGGFASAGVVCACGWLYRSHESVCVAPTRAVYGWVPGVLETAPAEKTPNPHLRPPDATSLSPDRMSVRDTQARLATPGDEVIVPADAGQLACLAAIDDADYIIEDEVVLKSGVPEAASLSYDLFKDCDSSENLAAVLYGSRPNVVLVGEMTEYDKIQHAIKRLLADLPMLGRFVAILLEPVSDDDDRPSFLNRALALNSNLPFGCEKLQMADRSLMHMRTHDRFDVWIASSTRDSRSLSPPPTYKLLRLMTPGAEVDKVVFHKPNVRDNQYAVQVHNDLVNGLLGSIGMNSDEVHLLPGTDPRNSKLFFTELNEEQVNAVVSQFGSKPRFQIQPVAWYRGANVTSMTAVYEVWIKKTHKETWSPMLYASILAMFWTIPGVLQAQSPVKIHVLGPSKLLLGLTETGHSLLKTRYRELVAAIGAVFKDLRTGQFLDRDVISKPTIPSTWKKDLVGTMYLLDVAPWWYLSDLTEALAPSVHCRYIADRVRWSVGEMRTATWRLTGESVTQLIGKVYLSDSGMPPMFVISEADYEARKRRITDRPRNTDDSKTRRQGLITAGEMAKAMELDDQVDKVISSLKRKRDLKEDEASSSSGAPR